MPIGPVSDSHREINVVEPLSPAFEHVKRVLFQPFDLGKWFVIGFCAWLAGMGERGGFNSNLGGNHHTSTSNNNHLSQDLRHALETARDFIHHNLYWIVPVAAVVLLAALAFGLLILWLNSRGKFMFLHCVAHNKAEVVEPWNRFAAEGNRLFWFRFVLQLAAAVFMLPAIIFMVVLIARMIAHEEPDPAAIMLCVGLFFFVLLFVFAFALVNKFIADFIVPIMYLRGQGCLAAWKELWELMGARPGQFILYLLFQIVISAAIGVILLFAVLLTCCLAGCLMAIPYLGTVLLLPVLVFKRSYPLFFLRQFGPAYDVFPLTVPPSAPTGLQPSPGLPPRST